MMKLSVLLLASSVFAFPALEKRQDVSSAVSSAVASATSAVASAATSASASAAAPSASTSQSYGAGLLAALRERQATTLATLIEPLAPVLEPVLSQGSWTIFAPGNEYLAAVDTSNSTAVQEILSYHLVAGDYPAASLPENTSVIAPTFLTNSMLGANYTQFPIAFAKDVFGTTNVIGQNVSVLGNSTYQNVIIKLIDGVLIPPGPVPEVIAANGGDALVTALGQLLPDVASTLNTTAGITVFAPANAAIEAAASTLASLASTNPQAVSTAVQGHVIPSVVFSTNITDGLTVTSLGGTPLTFAMAGGAVTVTGNGVTATITQPDLIAENGVVHIIDALLFTPPAGGAAGGASGSASSAVASATSSAAGAASSAAGAASSAVGAASSAAGAVTSAAAAVTSA